ncbi:MAG: hypothetical protein SGI71_01415 [Verrucomicrobiota bacterium]|nr:hypothetical protein [Verrucomicrobiota bacterium]
MNQNLNRNEKTAFIIAVVAICFGALALFWSLIGGLCCGWAGWPFGIIGFVLSIVSLCFCRTKVGVVSLFVSIGAFLWVLLKALLFTVNVAALGASTMPQVQSSLTEARKSTVKASERSKLVDEKKGFETIILGGNFNEMDKSNLKNPYRYNRSKAEEHRVYCWYGPGPENSEAAPLNWKFGNLNVQRILVEFQYDLVANIIVYLEGSKEDQEVLIEALENKYGPKQPWIGTKLHIYFDQKDYSTGLSLLTLESKVVEKNTEALLEKAQEALKRERQGKALEFEKSI